MILALANSCRPCSEPSHLPHASMRLISYGEARSVDTFIMVQEDLLNRGGAYEESGFVS